MDLFYLKASYLYVCAWTWFYVPFYIVFGTSVHEGKVGASVWSKVRYTPRFFLYCEGEKTDQNCYYIIFACVLKKSLKHHLFQNLYPAPVFFLVHNF